MKQLNNLAICKERGEQPQKPYSGDMKLQVSPESTLLLTAETQ